MMPNTARKYGVERVELNEQNAGRDSASSAGCHSKTQQGTYAYGISAAKTDPPTTPTKVELAQTICQTGRDRRP
jgi:hypothetical protein